MDANGNAPASTAIDIDPSRTAIGDEEVLVDEIIRGTGLTSAAVSATLLGLEMKRIVKQLPGRQYARNPALGQS